MTLWDFFNRNNPLSFPIVPTVFKLLFCTVKCCKIQVGWRSEKADFLSLYLTSLRATFETFRLSFLIQFRLIPYGCHTIELIPPSPMTGSATSLRFDFLRWNCLFTMDTRANAAIDCAEVRIFAIWTMAASKTEWLETDRPIALLPVWNDSHGPFVTWFGQPGCIQKRCLAMAMRARDHTAVEESGLVRFWFTIFFKQRIIWFTCFYQRSLFFIIQRRHWRKRRHIIIDRFL